MNPKNEETQDKKCDLKIGLLEDNFAENSFYISEEESLSDNKADNIYDYPSKRVCLTNDNIHVKKFKESKELACLEDIPFPNGTIKITAVKGYKETTYDITIENDILKAAVLSAFVIDPIWVLSKIQLSKTIVVFIHHAKSDKEKQAINELYLCFPNVSAIFPSMEGANCMHCKLQLLFYTTYLRVVIPSANLVDYDWGETGVMENSMYIHDFPRRESAFTEFSTNFERDLFHYCKAKNYPDHILKKMQCYDFKMSKNIHFVHSIPARALNSVDLKDTGYLSLARAVQKLGKASKNDIEINIIVTSSLGLLKSAFMTNIYRALKGDQSIASYNMDLQSWKTSIKVHFPSINTVLSSNGGKESAGTICFQKQFWENLEFPKSCLMHHKIILVRNSSANLSESAW
ncbi:unnamed protein product [Pneumocystis jirovecii]|uniref:Uncharacterized protein n=1 Tax=Pneumocystis jirovecii TaxID=42068 RepID=L0PFV5_PNEJI|nr:unnamed protein product [Pneumocystis jirovecii]